MAPNRFQIGTTECVWYLVQTSLNTGHQQMHFSIYWPQKTTMRRSDASSFWSCMLYDPKTELQLNTRLERTYNGPWCGKCREAECIPRPLWFSLAECLTSKNLGLKLTDQQVRVSLTLRMDARICEKHICRCGKVVGENGHPVPEARDVFRGTTTSILPWNKRWVPSMFPQFWNQMVWIEQTRSAQMELP